MVDSPIHARNKLAAAFRKVAPPTPDVEAQLRADLATSKLDAAIRQALRGARLGDAHLGHLIGLLLNESGVDGATSTVLEKMVREAVRTSQAAKDGE